MFWGKVAWCPCASTNIKEMTIGVNVGCSSEVLCVTLQSQNWCFHLVSASFLETAWLFSSRALLRNAWAVMTFLKICSFFFDSKKHLLKNKLNTFENYSLCGQEELKSHSSLVSPEGTSFPLHVAKSFCVQNFSEIPFSWCTHTTQLLQSRQAHCIRQMQMQPVLPLGASSLVSVGGICCVTSFGNLFFFSSSAMFLRFMCCSVQWNCYLYGPLLLYSSQGVQKYSPPMDQESSWKPD